jgi:hypothetical protein
MSSLIGSFVRSITRKLKLGGRRRKTAVAKVAEGGRRRKHTMKAGRRHRKH